MFTVLLASGVAAVAAQKTFVPNMNGEYALSRTPGATGDFSTNYSDYPGGAEYFEVYSPAISTLYSQGACRLVYSVSLAARTGFRAPAFAHRSAWPASDGAPLLSVLDHSAERASAE
eukprot:gene10244-274_t